MMIKRRDLEEETTYGYSEVLNGGGLEKTARQRHIPDKLASAIQEIQAADHPDHTFLYDRALGAGETYGPNNNGDFFSKQACQDHHPTFVKHGHLFRHHQNKDPNNAIGEIVKTAYNHEINAVDLIAKAPIEKVAEDLEKLEEGQVLNTSMGAKVKYDVCSICDNKARTRMQYCTHLRNQMGNILPDGRQVYAKNPKPRFVDLSMVVVPADPTSGMLSKIASQEKSGEIDKETPSSPVGRFDGEGDGRLHEGVIQALIGRLSKSASLKTAELALGRPVSPDEFQAIMRKDASLVRPDIIPVVYDGPVQGKPLSGRPHRKIARMIKKANRAPLGESPPEQPADFLDAQETALYRTYRHGRSSHTRAFLR